MNRLSEPYTTQESLAGVRGGIERCLERAADIDRLIALAPGVSKWSVQDHLEHLLLSDRRTLDWISGALDLPGAGQRTDFPGDTGRSLLAFGKIPRGRGPAPDFTCPTGMEPGTLGRDFEHLRVLAEGLGARITDIDVCERTLPHHVLGHFTPAEWLRFLHLHHRHHEAIISDILAA